MGKLAPVPAPDACVELGRGRGRGWGRLSRIGTEPLFLLVSMGFDGMVCIDVSCEDVA